MPEKIVIIGAGSAMFTRGLVADLVQSGEECALALVDIDPEALQVAEALTAKMIAATGSPITLRAATDRCEVLPGATVVICTIGVGGRAAWEADVYIPRQFGIFQPVGDSMMPGGASRALRMLPDMVAIARDVLALAPGALFFNYGNPMAAICRGVRKATGAPMIGLCHGTFQTAKYLAGKLGVDCVGAQYTAVGMNHLTWFLDFFIDGHDLMPRLREMATMKSACIRNQPSPGGLTAESRQTCLDDTPFSWELLETFGAFPAVLDRHVTEFFPTFFPGGAYYGRTLGVDAYSFEETIQLGNNIYAEMQEAALSQHPLPDDYFASIGGEHEQVLEIIGSIRQNSGKLYHANLPNEGQVPNLPSGVIVECPVIAAHDGLHPLPLAPLTPALAAILSTRLAWVDVVVEAALTGSRELFIQALLLDGSVNTIQTAIELADALLAAHAAYLPQFSSAAQS